MGLLLGIDFLTKAIALRWIPPLEGGRFPYGGIAVFENIFGINFSLNTVVNTGAAWGVFPNHFFLLLLVRISIISALVFYLLFFRPLGRSRIPFWLIVTGALGNIIDMFYYGHVIDFFHVTILGWSFPIFNVADSCITCGVILLLILPNKNKSRVGNAS
jgi:signal peptidase II